MGGTLAKTGDVFTCLRKHENAEAIHSTIQKFGVGQDLDEAVLAATNQAINNEGLMNLISLSLKCENLPNMDTFTRSDAMCVLYS